MQNSTDRMDEDDDLYGGTGNDAQDAEVEAENKVDMDREQEEEEEEESDDVRLYHNALP